MCHLHVSKQSLNDKIELFQTFFRNLSMLNNWNVFRKDTISNGRNWRADFLGFCYERCKWWQDLFLFNTDPRLFTISSINTRFKTLLGFTPLNRSIDSIQIHARLFSNWPSFEKSVRLLWKQSFQSADRQTHFELVVAFLLQLGDQTMQHFGLAGAVCSHLNFEPDPR